MNNYFETKIRYSKVMDDGKEKMVTESYIVDGMSFTEVEARIIKEMEAGLNSAARRKSVSITDRKEAIKTAVSMAHTEDIILIAGKGHETYQEIMGVRHDFDDFKIVKEFLELMNK